ncbi:Gfo/Idh/MocA family protein [Streptomyces albus]|uniref:Gfo/Idh/MocA family protein n=1 Tax=Streptomyces albus TaxID=1888 RepID=UPI003456CA19
MRIGLVGAGRTGTLHARTLSAHPEVTELVVADADPIRAVEAAAALDATPVPGVRELLELDIHALVVATAPEAQAELLTAAARRGLPAFCETPLAPDAAGTREVLAEVAAAGTLLQAGFPRRFDAGHAAARDAVRSGRLGRLHTVRALTSAPAPPFTGHAPCPGGLFRHCLVHDIDAVRWVTGREIVSVYATGAPGGADGGGRETQPDTVAALLTLDDGGLCTLTGTRRNGAGYDMRMELAGERDQIAVGLDVHTPLSSVEPAAPPAGAERAWPGFLDRFGPAYEAQLAAFVRALRGQIPNPCDGRQALAAVLVAEGCERSRLTGAPVRPAALDSVPL